MGLTDNSINKEQADNVEVWRDMPRYSITEFALLSAGVSPYRCKSVSNVYPMGYSGTQAEHAFVMERAIIASLDIGTLIAQKIVIDGEHGKFMIEQDDLCRYNQEDISSDDTYILRQVLFNWTATHSHQSLGKKIRARQNQEADLSAAASGSVLTFDPASPKYPIELHAANEAYKEVSQLINLGHKTPKQIIENFLNVNFGDRLGLGAIQRVSTVANYDKRDGSKPKTKK